MEMRCRTDRRRKAFVSQILGFFDSRITPHDKGFAPVDVGNNPEKLQIHARTHGAGSGGDAEVGQLNLATRQRRDRFNAASVLAPLDVVSGQALVNTRCNAGHPSGVSRDIADRYLLIGGNRLPWNEENQHPEKCTNPAY